MLNFRQAPYRLLIFTVPLLCALGPAAAQAQPQVPRPRPAAPGTPGTAAPGGRAANPAHERAKMDAEQAYHRGEFQQAIDLTTRVLNQNPRDHVAYYLRGSARVELGRATGNAALIREGVADARESVRTGGGENVMFYLPYLYGMTSLAEVEDRESHAQAAVTVAAQLLDRPGLNPQDKSNLLYQRAMSRMFLEDFAEAQADYAEAVKLNPQHLGAYTGLAEAHVAADEPEKALAAFDQAVRAFPESPLVYNNRGMFRQQQGETDEAVGDFSRAAQLDPNYFVAYTNRGYARLEAGRTPEAIRDFNESLRIQPNQPMVYSLRGTAQLAAGDTRSAIADYTRSLQFHPENPIGHADLGFARTFAREDRQALESFETALSLEPELRYVDPWRFLLMLRIGQAEAAQQKFQPRLKADAEKWDWIDRLLAFHMEKISADKLLAGVEKTDEDVRTAQLCEAHYFIGQHHLRAGRRDEAAQHFQKALDTGARYLSAYRGAQFELNALRPAAADAGAQER